MKAEEKEKYILTGIDDLISNNHEDFNKVIKKDKARILCVGTALDDICNYNCIYCYAGDIMKKKKREMLTFDDYQSLFSQAVDCGCKSVIITGALSQSEPLLSNKLIPLLQFLKSQDVTPILFTNMYVAGNDEICEKIHNVNSKELIEILDKCNVSLMISCDSIDKEVYESTVAVEGSYKVFSKALNNLEEVGFKGVKNGNEIVTRVGISTVISRDNYNELAKMKEFFHQKNWQFICKFPSLMGHAVKNKVRFFTTQEVEERRANIRILCDKAETLTLSYEGERYCLMNQLGIAFNSLGQPLTCLSGEVAFDDEKWNIKNKKLKDIIYRKKRSYCMDPGECPKKGRYYSFKGYNKGEDLN